MPTITDAATTLTTGTLAAADTNAQAFANYLTPANIGASATAAGLPLATLMAAREIFGGPSALGDTDGAFVQRAQRAAKLVLGT